VGGYLQGRNAQEAEAYRRAQAERDREDRLKHQAMLMALEQAQFDAQQKQVGVTNKRNMRLDERVPMQVVDRLGPDGRPRTYQIPEYGGEPMDTGLQPIPEPQGGGMGGSGRPLQQSDKVDAEGNPLIFDPVTGQYLPATGQGVRPFLRPTEQQGRFGGMTPTIEAARAELAAMESPGAVEALVSRPPVIGNFITTDAQREYNNALKRYMLSVYLVSGQAFPEKEWRRMEETWGYVPGDDARVIQNKARARDLFVEGLIRMTPPQYRPQSGAGQPAPATAPTPATKGKMSKAAYDAARAEGYTDEEIRAEGWDLP